MHDTVRFTYAVTLPTTTFERENLFVAVESPPTLLRIERPHDPPEYPGTCLKPRDIVTAAARGDYKVVYVRKAGKVVEESY